MKPLALVLALALPFAATAQAAISYDLHNADSALELNHHAVSERVVDLLFQVSSPGDSSLTRAKVASRLVENRLLGDYAKATYSSDDLFAGQRVAFRHDILMQNELTATLKAAFRVSLQQAMTAQGHDVGSTVTKRYTVAPKDFDRVFGSVQATRLSYDLDAAHEAEARKMPLLAYRFPSGHTGTVSLDDVYVYQNVQGRVMIHNRDVKYLYEQALLLVENLFIMDWVEHKSGLSAGDIALVRQAVEDRAYRDGLIHYMGLEDNAEEGTPYLTQLAGQVKPEEIRRYYEAHKDQFKQIDKVRASHITVASEADAKVVSDALAKGEKFADVARRYSIAADKASGGDMGWIAYTKNQAHPWIEQLAFIQQPGTVSRPVRTPVANGVAHWEIVKVDERTESYLPADSHEVRFAASDAVAHQQALANFDALKKRLLAKAELRVNPQWLPTDSLQF